LKTVKEILEVFSGATPLFPLPDFVFFPKTVQPFHIFEPRYIEMVNDAKEGERLITIALIKAQDNGQNDERPSFCNTGTLGYINQVQELEEGKYNILVTGLVKVKVEEVESAKAYRRGAVTPLQEFSQVADAAIKEKNLLRLFETVLERANAMSNLDVLAEANVPLEMVTHIIISALPIAAEEKQKMLELQSLELRIEILQNFLESGLSFMGNIGQFESLLPAHPWWN